MSPEFWQTPWSYGTLSATPLSAALGVVGLVVLWAVTVIFKRFLARRVLARMGFEEPLARTGASLVSFVVFVLLVLALLPLSVKGLATTSFLFHEVQAGVVSFTPLSLALGIVLIIVLIYFQGWLKKLLLRNFFPKLRLDSGVAHSLSTLAGYIILVIGLLAILPVAFPGFRFTTLSVILGAISFGIGFGLRNIADNFVSGLIILFERPIKVGDRVELGSLAGAVTAIRARSTSIRTNDNIDIIVPNAQFISEQVVNWSHGDNLVRFRIPVGVHYNSDVAVVKQALEEAGVASEYVKNDPAPSAMFMEFGDSSLNFQLWVWTDTMSQSPSKFRSHINYLIWDHLKKHGIEIPYPQRDLYIKEDPEHPLRAHGTAEDPADAKG